MKESKAYKTYLGYATCTIPPKVAKKFKKASPSKKDSVPVPTDEEPVQKGKRSKRKEKVDVARGNGIDLLSEVALIKEAQMKEVGKKSLRDFHKSHPSGSGSIAEKPPSVEKITPTVTNEGTGDKPGVLDVTKDDSTESESKSWGNDEDDSNDEEGSEQENDSEEHESDSEQDTDGNDDEDDDNDDDQSEGDEDRGMNSDNVLDKKADVGMTDAQQEKENSKITKNKSLKMLIRDDKDKDEIPSARSDRGLKKQKTSKDAEPTTSPKTKDLSTKFSKGTKSQLQSSGKYVHAEEPEFEVGDTNTPQGQEGNQDKTPQTGPTQNWLMTLATLTSTSKSLKEFNDLMSTPIDFSFYILNGLKIKNLTQQILLGPAFRLLKGTRSNYAELEYDFEECYKDLSEKLDWEIPQGDDYPFDLSKPLPLIMRGNHQSVPV
uniref:Uncharacterized protein n=1 Tax=Tanacetum cinerariifolium TaxID=118510 RepID=A0A6L2NX05_TANCI|nr:hypothetical protein [Tanacetum cinerariifolium]